METTIQGKTILISGATNGIGLVTAQELARMGGLVTIIGRKAEKCAAVAAAIRASTGRAVETITADLSTLAGIRQAAEEFKQHHDHLHVLINNAGGFFNRRVITVDGFEYTFALNHLNYFLLTNLLLDLLKSSTPARIINVSSGAHTSAPRVNFNNLQGERFYTSWTAYTQSKLENLLFTYELARRLEGSGITANALHPGYVYTGFARNNGLLFSFGAKVAARMFARKPEKGAQTSLYLAASPEVSAVSGRYFSDCRPIESSPASHDQAAGLRLWELSAKLTGIE